MNTDQRPPNSGFRAFYRFVTRLESEMRYLAAIVILILVDLVIHMLPVDLHEFINGWLELGVHAALLSAIVVLLAIIHRRNSRERRALLREIETRQRTEEALAQEHRLLVASQQKLAMMMEQTPVAIFESDVNNKITSWNPAAEMLFGYTVEEAIGQDSIDLMVAPSARDFVVTSLKDLWLAKVVVTNINESITKSGELITCQWYNVPLVDDNGSVITLMSIAVDITERIRAEAAMAEQHRLLAESQQKLALLVEQMPVAIIEWTNDFKVMTWNPAAERIFGFTAEEVIGKSALESMVPKVQLEDVGVIIETMRRERLPVHNVNDNITKDGRVITCEWYNVPLVKNEQVIGQASMAVDITQRQRAETALRDSEARYRAAAEGSMDAFFLLESERDAAGKIVDFRFIDLNGRGEAHFDMPRSRLIGERLSEIAPINRTLGLIDKYAYVVESGETLEEDFFIPPEFPRSGWYHHQVVPLSNGIAISNRDITERKVAEEQMLQLELERERVRLLGNFIADVSHDFRTPLSVLNTSLYLLRRTNDPQRQSERIQVMETQVTRLEKLLNQLLLMARLDSVTIQDFAPVNLNTILRNIRAALTRVAEQKGLSLDIDLAKDIAPVNGNETYLHRAIQNLVENAIEHTSKGHIILRSSLQGGSVIVQVQDTGSGIPPDDLPHIFERFFRGDKARSVETGGAGLGLPIVKRVVEIHNGTIEAASVPGEGSVFTITLPAADEKLAYTLPFSAATNL